MSELRISRRAFLRTSVVGLGSIVGLNLLAACGGQGTVATPTGSAGGPTAAAGQTPAASVGATAGRGASAAPSPAGSAKPGGGDKIGASLIGKLEGATVITDTAQYPKTFSEAPQLAEQVKAGKLPPVAERVGQDPLVLKPLREVGKYGGTWRRGFTGPGDKFGGWRVASGTDAPLYWDYTGEKIVPNIARSYEVGDGGRTLTLQLRRGMKWSDGQPFTADDFMFWHEDMFSNAELVPSKPFVMTINGKVGKLEKVDATAVRFVFPEPYYLLPDILASTTALGGQAAEGLNGNGGYAPAHYLKQFHPKYVAKDELDRKVAEAKVDNWVTLFKAKNDWALNPDLPVVSPWKVTSPINTPNFTLERNPYSIWVDTQGNQLPYIDRVQMSLAENLEVVNLRAIAGEYDLQARHLDIGKLPVLVENQQRGNYTVHLDTGDYGSDVCIYFNLNYDKDPELSKWFGNTDFRRALSLGIDRDQLNETFWLGTGTPGSMVPGETNKYNPGAEFRTRWHTHDVAQANALLDKAGLTQKDGEGLRQRSDGKGRLRLEITTYGAQFLPYTQIMEVIGQQWKRIGIDLTIKEVERSLGEKQHAANETIMFVWTGDGTDNVFLFSGNLFPTGGTNAGGPLYGQWFQTFGAQGLEPPPRLKEMMEKFRKAFGVPEAERIQLAKEVWQINTDECYRIGVVGLAAASMGVRVVKNTMGNVPERQFNSPVVKNPSISRPMTFYFKS